LPVSGITSIGLAFATFGLVSGGLVGGPIAGGLIKRFSVQTGAFFIDILNAGTIQFFLRIFQ